MPGQVAIIAGTGALPGLVARDLIAQGRVPLVAGVHGYSIEGLTADIEFRAERMVPFMRALADQGVTQVIFAGAVQRPRLDPALFDPETAALVPRILAAMQQGDDGLLRGVIGFFEEAGLPVVGVADIAPALVPPEGVLGAVQPTEVDRRDVARAKAIVAGLGALDVGQGAVVAQGLCLAVEALPGTDAMLRFVAGIDPVLRRDPRQGRGVLYKAPKPGQDRRIDLPALGLQTVIGAAEAGLGGIAFAAGGVVVLDRDAMVAEADACGLFLWSCAP
ncbi:MAG: DUF1009 domain-containing protein [Rhodobacteraceae bacterium]|nr:DUF1009 domain-containing protein [Paracoccaceae bacterium]